MKGAVDAAVPTFLASSTVAREYGERTVDALIEMVRLADVGARLVTRGHGGYSRDPDNAPGLACEGLVIRLGENVSRVSAPTEADHPEVPWRVIEHRRNRLTHYYEATDDEVVWSTIEEDFPRIRSMVVALLAD